MLRSLVFVGLLPGLAVAGVTAARPIVQPPPPIAPVDSDDGLGEPPLEIVDSEPVALPEVERLDGATPERIAPIAAVAARPVELRARERSIEVLNRCHAAIAEHRLAAAIELCRAATVAWDGNHLAWYGLANVHAALEHWPDARAAARRAVELRPGLAMYQLRFGLAAYRSRIPDRLALARAALERAVALEPRLWRAHYQLGVVAHEQHDDATAAAELTAAIRANPDDRRGYLALAELYRLAGRVDPAVAVATLGIRRLAGADAAGLWHQLALVRDAQADGAGAVIALNHAIALSPDDAVLKLARARLHFQLDDLGAARRDLTDASRATDPAMAAARQRAIQLLAELAANGGLPDAAFRTYRGPRDRYMTMIPNASWMGSVVSPVPR